MFDADAALSIIVTLREPHFPDGCQRSIVWGSAGLEKWTKACCVCGWGGGTHTNTQANYPAPPQVSKALHSGRLYSSNTNRVLCKSHYGVKATLKIKNKYGEWGGGFLLGGTNRSQSTEINIPLFDMDLTDEMPPTLTPLELVCMSTCLPVCVCLSDCAPVCLSTCLSACVPACLSVCLSARQPAYMF